MGQANKSMIQQDSIGQVHKRMSQQGNRYQVFLSFSGGEFVQESFVSRLYSCLREARISVHKNDISISSLPHIIGCSEISIIIFSEHYVGSNKCLQEFTQIVESKAHLVVPIFYGVDQSSLGLAFRALIERTSPTIDQELRWRRALVEAGVNNCGFAVSNSQSNNESEVIQNVVELVRHILDRKDLVGVSSQVEEVIRILQKHQSKDVLSIGIWGMSGIGKTTLARLIFEKIHHEFKSKCFLSNVSKGWERRKVEFVSETRKLNGISDHKKVLLVLDDVSRWEQLHALCGNPKWFGEGSRIIITTRDLRLLEAFQVDDIYTMRLLSDHESLQLFSKKASKQSNPEGTFAELNRRIVAYAEGLPLALKVLGSFLHGQSSRQLLLELMEPSTDLPSDIYNRLKLPFDSLDSEEKEIFISILSFYIGENIHDVIQKLYDRGCNASIGTRVLVDRSLVTIDNNNKLRMHNLFQLFGRQIMRESSQNELRNRGHRYEVFLSFRGEDTRGTFTSHLYSALCNAGIIVFKDDVELPRGNHIKTELLQALGSSKIAIIIFSKEYAASKWCLEELSIIMELHKSNDQVILPVFYNVDPSEIRNQTSNFGEAFKDHIQKISPPEYQVSKWKTTLRKAADIAGIVVLGSSLVTYDEKNKLGMHDLLRDMGREIIRKQSEKELGKRSRLWFHENARVVLSEHMGTKTIEGLSLKLSQSEKLQFQTEAFRKMKRLRLLHLNNVQLRGDYEYLSKDLRWLCWHGFSEKYIPNNFYQQKLVVIDLQYSSLQQVWKEPQTLEKLKILNLSHCPHLVQTPDFSKLPNLEKLILQDCPSLANIHHSIGLLGQLFLLDLEDCIGLHNLPRSIYRLKRLKTLILSGCLNIEKLEEDIEQMESLTTLIAPVVKQVPFSLVRLRSILYLSICGYEGLSHHVIPSLYQSWMSPTNSPLPFISTHACMPSSSLQSMLNSNHCPSTILSSVPKQQRLLLEDGLEIPDSLCATNIINNLRLENCLGHCLIKIGKNAQVFCKLSAILSQGLNLTKNSYDCIDLPGDNYPYWLAFKDEGASVKFKVPPVNGYDHLKGIAICFVYAPSGDSVNKACESSIICLMIINYTKTTTLAYIEDKLNSLEEVEKKEIISNLEYDDQVEVKAVFANGFIGKKTAVYFICDESFDE